jgi:uncharacterized protein with von Willebrand factor type A (vWA) domain
MARRVKDFIEISEFTALDDLIRFLQTIRDTLPEDSEAELKIRGDEIFGHRLTISFLRELTPEEAQLEARYAGDVTGPDEEAIEDLRKQLDQVPYRGSAGGR